MIEPALVTWIIAIFGSVIFIILIVINLLLILNPDSKKVKDIFIGKGEEWRDKTHKKSALAFALGDLLIIFPILIAGLIGVFTGKVWGYILWIVLGTISIYFSIVFWVLEKEYTYPANGALAYYTYIWGFYLYWGIAAVVYSIIRIT